MRITSDNPAPFFEQIAEKVRAAIAAGVYRAGDPIPSIRAQASRLLINPNTIKRAYEELEREGIIESRKGLGMYVSEKAAEISRERVEVSVRETFTQGVKLGSAAELSRTRIDEAYRKAWSDARKSEKSEGSER